MPAGAEAKIAGGLAEAALAAAGKMELRFVGNRATSDTFNVIEYTTYINQTTFTGGRLVEGWRLQSHAVGEVSFGGRCHLGKMRYGVSAAIKNVTDETYLVQSFHLPSSLRAWRVEFPVRFAARERRPGRSMGHDIKNDIDRERVGDLLGVFQEAFLVFPFAFPAVAVVGVVQAHHEETALGT